MGAFFHAREIWKFTCCPPHLGRFNAQVSGARQQAGVMRHAIFGPQGGFDKITQKSGARRRGQQRVVADGFDARHARGREKRNPHLAAARQNRFRHI